MDINGLIKCIEDDLARERAYDRYPVRFFSLKYESGVSEKLIQLQRRTGIEIFDLKKLLPHDDAWISPENLRRTLYENLSLQKSYMIVGFSEYARFLSTERFITVLLSLIELENSAEHRKRRIYFPCFALYSQIKKTIETYHRRLDVYNPLLNEAEVEDLPKIYFIKEELSIDTEPNQVTSSAQWFGMWRNTDINPAGPIICSSKTLSRLYRSAIPDNVYNIKEIASCQDALRCMYGVEGIYAYQGDEDGFYRQLISSLKSSPGLELGRVILTELNVQNINPNNVYSLWKQSTLYKRWLLRNYVLLNMGSDTYLHQVMLEAKDLSDKEFLENTYLRIFDLNTASFCGERKAILSAVQKAEQEIRFSNRMAAYYNELVANLLGMDTPVDFRADPSLPDEARGAVAGLAPHLTCFSAYERQLTIWLYRSNMLNRSQIRAIYPLFASYLDGAGREWHGLPRRAEAYLNIYREVRLGRRPGTDYDGALHTWNKDDDAFYDWYFDQQIDFPEKHLKGQNFAGTVYVLDGVGAEYMGCLRSLLEGRGCSVDAIFYGKSHLPSTSSAAKEVYPPAYRWIPDFDRDVVHGSIYYHAEHLERAFTKLAALVEQITAEEGERPFAITADHGASVGHKLHKKEKKYDFEQSEHDGRCYHNKTRQAIPPSPDYIIYDDEMDRQWVIAFNQQSLYNNSKYAVHGGATPEELFVPVIIAHKGRPGIPSYRVEPVTLNVSGLQKNVAVKITPMPASSSVILSANDGTDTKMSYSDDTKTWTGVLKRGIEQDIKITVETEVFHFRTIPPTKMGGDDLFDD